MLNARRTIPYSFKVFYAEGIVWLYDDSARTYICSANPTIWAEPLYYGNRDCDDDLPESDYFDEKVVEHPIRISGDFPPDMSEKEAWEDARTEAHANHRI